MVITANLDGQGIREHLGAGRGNEASFDRLVEMTGGKFLEMKGASYRRNAK
jgi:DNA replication protein DnaC